MVTPTLARSNQETPNNTRKHKIHKVQTKLTQAFTVRNTPKGNEKTTKQPKCNNQKSTTKASKGPDKYIQSILKIRRKQTRPKPEERVGRTEIENYKNDKKDQIPKNPKTRQNTDGSYPLRTLEQHFPIARIVKKFERWRHPIDTTIQGKETPDKHIPDPTIGSIQNSHARLGY